MLCSILCFLLGFFNSSLLSLSLSLPPTHLCRPEHSSALLKFKSNLSLSFSIFPEELHIPSFHKTDSWDEGTDCCKWKGVVCDNKKGNVIGLDLSCSGLIVSLDLSLNYILFRNHDFNMLVHNLTKLENMVLDNMNLSLVVPYSFHNLTVSLKLLSLYNYHLQGNFPTQVFHLPYIQSIILRSNFNLIGYVPETNWSSPLSLLDVSRTMFSKGLPNSIGNIKLLKTLNLKDCVFMGSALSTLRNLTKITFLDISNNMFQGQIPDVFGNLNDLSFMDFSSNNFSSVLPSSAFNLTSLTFMDFCWNNGCSSCWLALFCSRAYKEFISSDSEMADKSLESSSDEIFDSNFSGRVVMTFSTTLHSLKFSPMSLMLLTVAIILSEYCFIVLYSFIFRFSKSLLKLINYCCLVLSDPMNSSFSLSHASLGVLPMLNNFSSNFLQGTLLNNISGLSYLRELYLYANLLSGRVLGRLFSLPSLEYLNLSFNKLNGLIDTIEEANLVQLVDLSKNEIQGTIPSSFFDLMSLTSLDLSSNNLSGNIKSCMLVKLRNLRWLDLSHNNLLSLTSCNNELDLFNNQIQGSITKWEAEGWEDLGTLSLSMNFLSSVEQILRKHLSILDFRFDSLQGPLPTPPQAMRFFLISNNELVGEIPSKICNLSFLSVLDLSTNNLGGTIPDCLRNFSIQRKLPHLQVLVLRSNRFHGDIQNFNGTFSFSSLRMIDLSRNEFTGHIPPELFENLKSMKDMQVDESGPEYIGRDYYQDSVIITMKGSDFKLERILTFFIVVDFSSNHFKGSIPKEVGELNSLIVLNFSHNRLASNIPPSLGKMTALESLDLSSNKLQGRIPVQLTDLTNLGELNLSHNNLEGQILLDNHFDTFSNDSFDGNSGLCGFPFKRNWTSAWIEYGIHSFHNWDTPLAKSSPPIIANESEIALIWKITVMGYGNGLVLGLSMGYIVFTTGRPRWLVKMIKRNPDKRIRRKIHRNGKRKN
ncbi:hypothetical protein ES332_A04G056300v1 [Gossypium tomentosum]|uniref:Leucine-rich repeat-containing N-terminal plant-type domain-containing protein n=1 Tax=Gossypium tomentosum TaxID=34277 RepID=A0A5D2QVB1_GOSTO|nr:hypothetical protein ES332_A04G056300v1 [Gossypium tomentosum]